MERQPEFRREPERPRQMHEWIEGRIETSFAEIDPSQSQPIPLHDIDWEDASLRFERVGTSSIPGGPFGMEIPIELYTGTIEFTPEGKKKKRRINLTSTTSPDKPVYFTGTKFGFYAYDPLTAGRRDSYYVVGVQNDELEANIRRLSAVAHELGHTRIFAADFDIQLLEAAITLQRSDLPLVSMAEAFAVEIVGNIPETLRQEPPSINRATMHKMETQNSGIERGISLFHERNAWAAGMNMVREGLIPTGFAHYASYFDYARLCLSTYARYYNDVKFVTGFKHIKRF